MKFWTDSFTRIIHGDNAFCIPHAQNHVCLGGNHNPHLAWSDLPAGTKSLVLICHDPDVPSRGDDVNQEGRTVPASLPRVDFFHWVLVDLPPSLRTSRPANSPRTSCRAARTVPARHAARARASTTTPAGSPATRTWPATISATTAPARRGTTKSASATYSRSTPWTSPLPRRGQVHRTAGARGDQGPCAGRSRHHRRLHTQSDRQAVSHSPRAAPSRRGSAAPIQSSPRRRMTDSPLVMSCTDTVWPSRSSAAAVARPACRAQVPSGRCGCRNAAAPPPPQA
jgi:phosphatidylethanolamine-binding protein (PEBP) family uncharacterized protein